MKYKKEIIITILVIILYLFLNYINIININNKLLYSIIMIIIIITLSILSIPIQKKIDKNYKNKITNYENLDILRYISSILIIILHLRPFIDYSSKCDLIFNNLITRICVPIFFVIAGYFIAKKEKKQPNYIKTYIKRLIPLYLIWSIIYVPIIIMTMDQFSEVGEFFSRFDMSNIFILLFVIFIVFIITVFYTGIYYHLWYFPAVIFSLLILDKWKKKYKIKYLIIMSFILLLLGATETYWGILPISIKNILQYYYRYFFTSRNFLFFGLFYVTIGYYLGRKKEIYTKYCFEKLTLSFILLVFETLFLHGVEQLNTNILLFCIPLVYYLFICTIYIDKKINSTKKLRDYSKYYYLTHPMIIFLVSLLYTGNNPFINIILVVLITHILSIIIIRIKKYSNKFKLLKYI